MPFSLLIIMCFRFWKTW